MYLIDGHNLIPKAGLSLRDVEDETHLINLLKEFARVRRKKIEVYFDGAPPGYPKKKKYGRVSAHFVRKGKTADDAILARLRQLGGAARNYIVVSSDRQVRANAESFHARVLSSEEFAVLLRQPSSEEYAEEEKPQNLSEEDVEAWMKIFGENKDGD
jgi:predicted RNA-binding protein with PIN domain